MYAIRSYYALVLRHCPKCESSFTVVDKEVQQYDKYYPCAQNNQALIIHTNIADLQTATNKRMETVTYPSYNFV